VQFLKSILKIIVFFSILITALRLSSRCFLKQSRMFIILIVVNYFLWCCGRETFRVIWGSIFCLVLICWQVLELCAGFCQVSDLRAVICRLISETSSAGTMLVKSKSASAGTSPLLTSIANWAVLSPTELTVAVECLQHFYEVSDWFVL